jgi:ribonuclease T2
MYNSTHRSNFDSQTEYLLPKYGRQSAGLTQRTTKRSQKIWVDFVTCSGLSTNQKRTCISCFIFILLFFVVGDGLFLGFMFFGGDGSNPDDPYIQQCYVAPSCTYVGPPSSSGYTNATGWSNSYGPSCCDACLPNTSATVCFSDSGSCANATGDADYDYLMLDEIWIPQFCRALSNGYDPTLSHVEDMRCAYGSNELSIHGLWPNYVDGYPQCCNASGTLQPLNPYEVIDWSIWSQMLNDWYDPTAVASCSTCYLLNHEWEKHGNCFSPGEPLKYFTVGLGLYEKLYTQNAKINALHGTIVDTAIIKSMYHKNVSIMCDNNDPNTAYYNSLGIGILLEIQSCWDSNFLQIDCAPPYSGSISSPCPRQTFIQSLLLLDEKPSEKSSISGEPITNSLLIP